MYGVDFETLKQVNSQLSSPDMIMPGMKIKIPSTSKPVKKKDVTKGEQVKKKEQVIPPKALIEEDDKKEMLKPKPQMPLMHQVEMPMLDYDMSLPEMPVPEISSPEMPKPKKKEEMPKPKPQVHTEKQVQKEEPQKMPMPEMSVPPFETPAPAPEFPPVHQMAPPMHMMPVCCYPVNPCCQMHHPLHMHKSSCGCGGQGHGYPMSLDMHHQHLPNHPPMDNMMHQYMGNDFQHQNVYGMNAYEQHANFSPEQNTLPQQPNFMGSTPSPYPHQAPDVAGHFSTPQPYPPFFEARDPNDDRNEDE